MLFSSVHHILKKRAHLVSHLVSISEWTHSIFKMCIELLCIIIIGTQLKSKPKNPKHTLTYSYITNSGLSVCTDKVWTSVSADTHTHKPSVGLSHVCLPVAVCQYQLWYVLIVPSIENPTRMSLFPQLSAAHWLGPLLLITFHYRLLIPSFPLYTALHRLYFPL